MPLHLEEIEVGPAWPHDARAAPDRWRRPDAHDGRIATGDAQPTSLAERLQPFSRRRTDGSRAPAPPSVGRCRCRARVDHAVLLKTWPAGQALQRVSGRLCSSRAKFDHRALLARQVHGGNLVRRRPPPWAAAKRFWLCTLYSSTPSCEMPYFRRQVLGGHGHRQAGVAVVSASQSVSSSLGDLPSPTPKRRPRATWGACDMLSPRRPARTRWAGEHFQGSVPPPPGSPSRRAGSPSCAAHAAAPRPQPHVAGQISRPGWSAPRFRRRRCRCPPASPRLSEGRFRRMHAQIGRRLVLQRPAIVPNGVRFAARKTISVGMGSSVGSVGEVTSINHSGPWGRHGSRRAAAT